VTKCTYVQFMTLRDALFEPMVEIVQYTSILYSKLMVKFNLCI
jgi:hypothetical protein